MSISSECSASVSDVIKSRENTMFRRTFSFMREYLRENRHAGELNYATTHEPEPEPYDFAPTPDLNLMPIDSFYQQSKLLKIAANQPQTAEPDQNAQMTIFYAGKVYVFNDLPANKAKDILFLAILGSSNTNTFPSNNLRYHNFPQPTDLPMKRKASLTRFFEKRKDRIMASAPYSKTSESQGPLKLNHRHNKSWLSLASS